MNKEIEKEYIENLSDLYNKGDIPTISYAQEQLNYYQALEKEELEEDRKRLSELGQAKLEIKNVFYSNLDDWHSEFIENFYNKYHKELDFPQYALIREVFQFLKTKI